MKYLNLLFIAAAGIAALIDPPSAQHSSFLSWLPMLLSTLGGTGASVAGNMMASSDRARAQEALERAAAGYDEIDIPQLSIDLEEYRNMGQLTPEQEQALLQLDTELNNIQVDPRLREAQLGALGELENVADQGGITLMDRANLERTLGDINAQERGARDAIMQNMAARGAGGSGLELAAALQNQQAAAEQASRSGLDIAAQAQQRALEAMMGAGQLGGQIEDRSYGQQMDRAAAQDMINRFNTGNRQDVMMRNTDRTNAANQYNLDRTQNLANMNTGLRNQEQLQNNQYQQQAFDNRMARQAGTANALAGQANNYNRAADQTANSWGQIGQGIMQTGAAIDQGNREQARWDGFMSALQGRRGG